MILPAWKFIAIGVAGVENLLYFAQPTWLARWAFLAGPERQFTLATQRRREPTTSSTYREPALTEEPLPALPPRTQLSTTVLAVRGAHVALRRAFGWTGRRTYWLYGIRVDRHGPEVTLRATQFPFGLSVPVVMPVFFYAGTAASLAMSLVAVTVFLVFVFGTQRFGRREERDAALREAFDFIEAEIRRGMKDE